MHHLTRLRYLVALLTISCAGVTFHSPAKDLSPTSRSASDLPAIFWVSSPVFKALLWIAR